MQANSMGFFFRKIFECFEWWFSISCANPRDLCDLKVQVQLAKNLTKITVAKQLGNMRADAMLANNLSS